MKSICRSRVFSCVFLFVFANLILVSPSLAQDTVPKISFAKIPFVVTQVIDHTDNDGWKNQLIAYGIRNIVNEELFDTGKYVPVEDRPEITNQIDKLIAANWGKQKPAAASAATEQLLNDVAACRVHVIVHDFKVKRRRSIGLFAVAKTTIKISVDVELHYSDGSDRKVTGSGKGVTKSLGILFQIREDKVHFNETTVGQATQKAIHNAIQKL